MKERPGLARPGRGVRRRLEKAGAASLSFFVKWIINRQSAVAASGRALVRSVGASESALRRPAGTRPRAGWSEEGREGGKAAEASGLPCKIDHKLPPF